MPTGKEFLLFTENLDLHCSIGSLEEVMLQLLLVFVTSSQHIDKHLTPLLMYNFLNQFQSYINRQIDYISIEHHFELHTVATIFYNEFMHILKLASDHYLSTNIDPLLLTTLE